jgi:hypothetical protein
MARQGKNLGGLAAAMASLALVLAACGASPSPTQSGNAPSTPAQAVSTRLPGEPDPALTPGVTNPAVIQANIATTICKSGWTATIRPPVSYTNGLKSSQMAAYDYADKTPALYEEDHLISLELGGNPTDPGNLWPEPYTAALANGTDTGAHVKDHFENQLRAKVCAGTMPLATAQAQIGDHWVHYALGLPLTATLQGSPSAPISSPTTALTSATPATSVNPGGIDVSVVSFTEAVKAGSKASITVQTAEGATCTIVVIYASGPSKAAGLEPKTADGHGQASWTWTVGSATTPGDRQVTVTCHQGPLSGSVDATLAVE